MRKYIVELGDGVDLKSLDDKKCKVTPYNETNIAKKGWDLAMKLWLDPDFSPMTYEAGLKFANRPHVKPGDVVSFTIDEEYGDTVSGTGIAFTVDNYGIEILGADGEYYYALLEEDKVIPLEKHIKAFDIMMEELAQYKDMDEVLD